MINLAALYLSCFASGASIESRLLVNDLVKRIVIVFTLAAGQLLISIQALSLMGLLNGPVLMLANVFLTVLFVGFTRFWPRPADRISWKALITAAWRKIASEKKDPLIIALATFALLSTGIYCLLGALMIPSGDSYHFEMPLFWMQNHSIRPFPVNNPRINTVSWAGEALALPGYLYFHTAAMFAVITFFVGILATGIVFSLTRRMGFSRRTSACAAAIIMGFPQFALTFLAVRAGSYLTAMWAGASLLFLMDCRQSATLSKAQLTNLGFSCLCLLMACGAKNSTVLLVPLYLIGLLAAFQLFLLKRPFILTLALCGGIGLLCSGVPWNYFHNRVWYGSPNGPQFMRDHLARDLGPAAAWTRICRGTAMLVFDPLWIPKSAKNDYAAASETFVQILGGQKELAEDDPFFGFQPEARTPLKGCGLVGILLLLPGLVIGIRRSMGCSRGQTEIDHSTRFNIILSILFAVGLFVVSHVILRWQIIGMLRLIPPFAVLAAPMCAFCMEKRWLTISGLGVLLLSNIVFVTHDLMEISRRFDALANNALMARISRFGNKHAMTVECKWKDHPAQMLTLHEDYTRREIDQKFLDGIAQPAVIGLVGGVNSETCWLFGRGYRNRVIPMVDDRKPDQLLEPPEDARYVVFSEHNSQADEWAASHNYQSVFRVTENGNWIFAAFEKERH